MKKIESEKDVILGDKEAIAMRKEVLVLLWTMSKYYYYPNRSRRSNPIKLHYHI